MISVLLIHGVPIECINKAAVAYYIPAKVIISVMEAEGGRPGLAHPNANGTYDFGPMQVNSIWVKKIARYGYTQQQLQYDPCANVMVGSWILSQQIANNDHYWEGIGDYNSHTPVLNYTYQKQVFNHYAALERTLSHAAA